MAMADDDYRPWVIKKLRLNFGGICWGLVFFVSALSPSLLPRGWKFEGVVCGVSLIVGYAFGVLVSWGVRAVFRKEMPGRVKRGAWWGLGIVGAAVVVAALAAGSAFQNRVRELVGEADQNRLWYVAVFLISLVVFGLLLGVGRGIRWCFRRIARVLERWVPARLAGVLALVVLVVAGFVIQLVARDGLVGFADKTYHALNGGTKPNTVQPVSSFVSGGPGSSQSWGSLGREGRQFVASGPSVEQIGKISGQPAADPIRVYVGIESGKTTEEQADIAVAELERTGAFHRAVLCVMTTTGSGWINERAADSLEYLYGGNTAEVAIQYSYFPSWISFVTDRSRATRAGRVLFDRVYDHWSALPAEARPKLLVFGESLGSMGGEAAFADLDNLRKRTDGVMWVGPTHSNRLAREFIEHRDPGTPEVAPVYEGGRTVRFASSPQDLANPPVEWTSPRVLYLMHANDPIAWWSPRLLFEQPDWLEEPRGRGVAPEMFWAPFVTFWQVTFDTFVGIGVPEGQGHRYEDAMLPGWVDIAAPPGWTADRMAALTGALEAH
ncbi:alpha/beta-hydrolase family protein [Nocardia sp. CDC153]|uniref:alpha/beta hydrolase n=1 Tax=Nocardia sp. CDC153 TaxID=3112167 RepID=UPI002DB9CAF1|nr:alpha/beta-hydrolase family protein [Nocardia sp. CDC153]MEC3957548.1 alpha/beta-hydrolase family protein [Nocardia sp. CDC153]